MGRWQVVSVVDHPRWTKEKVINAAFVSRQVEAGYITIAQKVVVIGQMSWGNGPFRAPESPISREMRRNGRDFERWYQRYGREVTKFMREGWCQEVYMWRTGVSETTP